MVRLLLFAVWIVALHARAAELDLKHAPAADKHARVPETRYDSAFTGYRPYREQKLASWRELNDAAHQAGGHAGLFGGKPTPSHPPEHKK